MIVWAAGGRDYDDYGEMLTELLPFAKVGNVLVTGAARGADLLAEHIWRTEFQLPYVGVPAPWDRMNRAAGMARNAHIARGTSLAPYVPLHPDVLVAAPGGAGTAGALRLAEKYGISIERIE